MLDNNLVASRSSRRLDNRTQTFLDEVEESFEEEDYNQRRNKESFPAPIMSESFEMDTFDVINEP